MGVFAHFGGSKPREETTLFFSFSSTTNAVIIRPQKTLAAM